jgi:hypothetical protein
MKLPKKQFYRSGKTIYEQGGKQVNYEILHELLKNDVPFKVLNKNGDRDITQRIVENIEKRIWTDEEEKCLRDNYGQYTLQHLHAKLLPKKTVGQIRHKASQLSLTVDQRWQPHEVETLSILRRSGVSFPIIAKILERPLHAVQVKAIKMRIVSHGHRSSNLEDAINKNKDFSKLSSLTKGKVAEDISTIELCKNGFDVWVPYTPQHHTDLVVIRGSSVAKIQVKAAVWDAKRNAFKVPLRRKIVAGKKKGERLLYDEDDVDFFMLLCLGFEAIYLVPFQLCKESGYANLYPHRPKQIHKGFDWEPYRENYQLLDDFFQISFS